MLVNIHFQKNNGYKFFEKLFILYKWGSGTAVCFIFVNGSLKSNRKSFEKTIPPFEVDLFSRLVRSDRNGPFHLTIPIHF